MVGAKKTEAEGYTLSFVDEVGFYLVPIAVVTWVPPGQTSVLCVTSPVSDKCRQPDYTPDLSKGIWDYLKCVELANVRCPTLRDLYTALIRARERLRHKQSIIRSCFAACGFIL